jgi:hypothetical protein
VRDTTPQRRMVPLDARHAPHHTALETCGRGRQGRAPDRDVRMGARRVAQPRGARDAKQAAAGEARDGRQLRVGRVALGAQYCTARGSTERSLLPIGAFHPPSVFAQRRRRRQHRHGGTVARCAMRRHHRLLRRTRAGDGG